MTPHLPIQSNLESHPEPMTTTPHAPNPQALRDLLQRCLSPDTTGIQTAQSALQAASKHPQFLPCLLDVIMTPSTPYSTALLAATYCNTHMRGLCEQGHDNVKSAVTLLLEFIGRAGINLKLRQVIGNALRTALKLGVSQKQAIKMQVLIAYLSLMNNHINISECGPDSAILQAVTVLGQLVLQHCIMEQQHRQKVDDTFTRCCALAQHVATLASRAITSKEPSLQPTLHQLSLYMRMLSKCPQPPPGLVQVAQCCLQLQVPGNTLPSPLFHHPLPDTQHYTHGTMEYLAHIKMYSIHALTTCLHGCNSQGVDIGYYLSKFVRAVGQLPLGVDLASQGAIVQQVYLFVMAVIASNGYYGLLRDMKTQLVFGCVMRGLMLGEQERLSFGDQPDELLNAIDQVVDAVTADRDINTGAIANINGNKKQAVTINSSHVQSAMQNQQPEPGTAATTNPHDHDNIRSLAARTLLAYTRHIDGTLAQLLHFIAMVLVSPSEQSIYSRALLLHLLAILHPQIEGNPNLQHIAASSVVTVLGSCAVPRGEGQASMEYFMLLYAVSVYHQQLQQLFSTIDANLLSIVEQILMDQSPHLGLKLASMRVLHKIAIASDTHPSISRTLSLLSMVLKTDKITARELQIVADVVDSHGKMFVDNLAPMQELIGSVVQLLHSELLSDHCRHHIVYKTWNILETIVSEGRLGHLIRPALAHGIASRLLPLFDSTRQLTLQQPLYRICTHTIGPTVTQLQLDLLAVTYRNFYHSQMANHSLLYSAGFVSELCRQWGAGMPPQARKMVLGMCVDSIRVTAVGEYPRSEAECAEGALLMQGLLVGAWQGWDHGMWRTGLQVLLDKLGAVVVYDFLRAALVTDLALVLNFAHGMLATEEVARILDILLREFYCFTYKGSAKLFILTLIEILNSNAAYVQSNYARILQCVVNLLKLTSEGGDKIMEGQTNDSEQEQYFRLRDKVKIGVENVDQFELFSKHVHRLKEQNPQLLDSGLQKLPENKRQYLRELVGVRKVNNEVRKIYRAKPRS